MSTDDRHDGASHQLQKLELVISGVPGKLPLETIKRELVGSGGRHLPIQFKCCEGIFDAVKFWTW